MLFIVILLLAASFGLNGPSSGQYLQKIKIKMNVHIVQKHQFRGVPLTFIDSLYNYH
jgi:hypothetical protein